MILGRRLSPEVLLLLSVREVPKGGSEVSGRGNRGKVFKQNDGYSNKGKILISLNFVILNSLRTIGVTHYYFLSVANKIIMIMCLHNMTAIRRKIVLSCYNFFMALAVDKHYIIDRFESLTLLNFAFIFIYI